MTAIGRKRTFTAPTEYQMYRRTGARTYKHLGLFGITSGAALAAGVGVFNEVPVMLFVERIVNQSRGWYERGALTAET